MDEIWKPVVGYEKYYHVSNMGKVRGVKSKKTLAQQPVGKGYRRMVLYHPDKKPTTHLGHRLVAQAFIPNIHNLPQVDHIDRQPANNVVENLRWASAKDQMANRGKIIYDVSRRRSVWKCHIDTGEEIELFESTVLATNSITPYPTHLKNPYVPINNVAAGRRKTAYGYKWKYAEYEDIEGETWKPIDPESIGYPPGHVTKYYISDHGRLKCPLGVIRNPLLNPNKYGELSVEQETYLSHRLVALTFLEKKEGKDIVNHIDGNKMNNHVSNLEFVDQKENRQHAVDTGMVKACIGVTQYDLDGNFMKNHISAAAAAREIGTHHSNLMGSLYNGYSLQGYQFRLTIGNEIPVTKVVDNRYRNFVSQYTLSGDFVREFKTALEASRITQINSGGISHAARKPGAIAGGFQWRKRGSTVPVTDIIRFPPPNPNSTPIRKYTEDKVLVMEYPSLGEAIMDTGYTGHHIVKSSQRGTMYMGFKWVRVETKSSKKRKRI